MDDQKKRKLLPVKTIADLPTIGSEQYSQIGKYAGAVVMACFERIGGLERMAEWADENPSAFYEKVFPKMISKSQQVDIKASVTLDDAINRLETIEGEFEVQEEWDL